eukprot:GEZU01025033.1.p1 GENE.GEZU01025033.1~~GEZU01025033.1.p1  ORF type:complete len:520 (+),score=34.55 GEZU01025033.1:267-1826(+)
MHPNARETCDGVDNNCNGRVDEGLLPYATAPGDLDELDGDDATMILSNTSCLILQSHPGLELQPPPDNADGDGDGDDSGSGVLEWNFASPVLPRASASVQGSVLYRDAVFVFIQQQSVFVIWKFNTTTLTWTEQQRLPNTTLPASASYTLLEKNNGAVMIFGGSTIDGPPVKTLYQYNIESGSLTYIEAKNDDDLSPRMLHTSVAYSGKGEGEGEGDYMLVYGGSMCPCLKNKSALDNNVWKYSTATNSWTCVFDALMYNGTLPVPRSQHSAAMAYGQYMIVYGGQASDGELLGDMWSFDTKTNTWRNIIPHPHTAPAEALTRFRPGFAIVSSAASGNISTIFLFGGINAVANITSNDSEVWTYQLQEETLRQDSANMPIDEQEEWQLLATTHLRGDSTAVPFGVRWNNLVHITTPPNSAPVLWSFFGYVGDNPSSDVWALDLSNNSWTFLYDDLNIPVPRVYHTIAPVTGSNSTTTFVLFGGFDTERDQYRNDVWQFDAGVCLCVCVCVQSYSFSLPN